MTPRSFALERAAFIERERKALERDVACGWFTAAFMGAAFHGKLPNLTDVLRRFATASHTRQKVRLEGQLLAERLGVAVKPISEAAKRALMRLAESGHGG